MFGQIVNNPQKFANDSNFLQKWRNFATSGHAAELVADDQAQVGVGGENKEQKGDEEKNEN